MAAAPLRPGIGFCLQTDTTGNPPSRWYINMCKHRLVEMPVSYSGKPVTKDWILTQGLGCLQVPFDIGAFRKLKERADGARKTAFCVDIVFNPLIITCFMDDEFCNKMDQFRQWIFNLALRRIEESIGVKLSKEKVKLVKQFRYKDGEDGDDTCPREFTELPDDRDSLVTDGDAPVMPNPQAEPEPAPLIEDVTPGQKKKTAIKKGFFNNKDGKSLYGPEGSKEGVLPENAGDPLGYLPKRLRNTAKIIDCNSPEYLKQQQEKKRIDEQNAMNEEFRSTMMEGFESFQRKQGRDIWSGDDMPEGTEEVKSSKYDNDYSRFEIIDEEPDKAPVDDRDWYYDEKGVPVKKSAGNKSKGAFDMKALQEQAAKLGLDNPEDAEQAKVLRELLENSATPDSVSAPAVKKGFLDGKKSIYGKQGSTQSKAPPSEMDMMKEFGNLLGSSFGDPAERRAREEDDTPDSQPSVSVKTSNLKAAEFKLKESEDGANLQLVVDVPGLLSMHGVNLDVTERRAMVEFPAGTGLRPLQVELPTAVVPTSVKAKFSKKTSAITVTLPRQSVN
eukprot:TRINITY_DN15016_c0_g1_i1.p1 TRINITY_DN15016_c0_g1~~TRINITY_DN15016_c0_g1_i1.p1  ORF type:complete len:558 (+),score=145.21 TRINITY_DN15016_c0_g1_i1:68-1741(+)